MPEKELFEILNAPGRTKKKLMGIQVEISNLRLMMLPSAIRYDTDRIQSTPQDPMPKYAERLLDKEKKYSILQEQYVEECSRVDKLLTKLNDIDQINVIRTHYVVGYTFEKTADTLSYSESHVYVLHRKAIARLKKMISE